MSAGDLRVEVVEVRGRCPAFRVGDAFYIRRGFLLEAEGPLCLHALCSILPYYVALSRGIKPAELGLGEGAAHVQCLDPCERTGGGTVIFRIVAVK